MAHKPLHSPISAQTFIALGFALIILLVALLLALPVASRNGMWTDPLTALFTATSAVCVTGLVVVDTATHWSLFGRCVLLAAIQIGGLGVMTALSLVPLLLGRRIGLRQRTWLRESVSSLHIGGIVRLVRRAFLITAVIEGIGTLLLAIRFVPMLGALHGLAYSLFHSISAFCNAGFDLMGTLTGPYTSLEAFRADPLVTLTIVLLILSGGLGFSVWDDLINVRFRFKRLRLHSRVVLLMLLFLLAVPTFLFIFFEARGAMAGMNRGERLLSSLFSAVTPRTAGFDLLPIAELSPASRLLSLLLMFIGGNPGSTAGGAKTTTVLLLALMTASVLHREEDVHVLGRRIDHSVLRRACSISFIYASVCMAATLTICALQPDLALGDVLLEVFSALNTVGMSTGVTRALNPLSRIVLILLMYTGRLGSLSFVLLLTRRPKASPLRRPVGQILIG